MRCRKVRTSADAIRFRPPSFFFSRRNFLFSFLPSLCSTKRLDLRTSRRDSSTLRRRPCLPPLSSFSFVATSFFFPPRFFGAKSQASFSGALRRRALPALHPFLLPLTSFLPLLFFPCHCHRTLWRLFILTDGPWHPLPAVFFLHVCVFFFFLLRASTRDTAGSGKGPPPSLLF